MHPHSVSYTHLDVYKRQVHQLPKHIDNGHCINVTPNGKNPQIKLFDWFGQQMENEDFVIISNNTSLPIL